MKRASTITLSLIGAFSAIQMAWAVDYPLPPAGSRLIGQNQTYTCLLYTSPSPRDPKTSRMPSSA